MRITAHEIYSRSYYRDQKNAAFLPPANIEILANINKYFNKTISKIVILDQIIKTIHNVPDQIPTKISKTKLCQIADAMWKSRPSAETILNQLNKIK